MHVGKNIVVGLGLVLLTAQAHAAQKIIDLQKQGDTLHLSSQDELVFRLPANLAAGYVWRAQIAPGSKLLDRSAEGEFYNLSADRTPIFGDSLARVLRFTGLASGWTEINFEQVRPWIKNGAPIATLRYRVYVEGAFDGVLAPRPAPTFGKQTELPPVPEPGLSNLPRKLNWADSGIVTPVKDQGTTGSCWAFGTCAAVESQIMRFGNRSAGNWVDCSEQYLVSTNPWGFSGMNGGWYPMPLFVDYVPTQRGQTDAGAVYEADLPFNNASNPDLVSVTSNLPHHEKMKVWGWVDGRVDGPRPTMLHSATTEQIKEALYRYGPVPVAINSSNWGSYTGGVFRETTYSPTNVTHIVLVTGYNDDSTNFYVKNSWGEWFGENGYIRLGYESDNVGSYPV